MNSSVVSRSVRANARLLLSMLLYTPKYCFWPPAWVRSAQTAAADENADWAPSCSTSRRPLEPLPDMEDTLFANSMCLVVRRGRIRVRASNWHNTDPICCAKITETTVCTGELILDQKPFLELFWHTIFMAGHSRVFFLLPLLVVFSRYTFPQSFVVQSCSWADEAVQQAAAAPHYLCAGLHGILCVCSSRLQGCGIVTYCVTARLRSCNHALVPDRL